MGLSRKCSTVICIHVVSMVLQNFGDFIAAQQPPAAFGDPKDRCFGLEVTESSVTVFVILDSRECQLFSEKINRTRAHLSAKGSRPLSYPPSVLPRMIRHLFPDTIYQIGLNYDDGKDEWRTTFSTLESALKKLVIFDTDPEGSSISLRWEPPARVEIVSYSVTLDGGGVRRNWTLEASAGIPMCEIWGEYVCIENIVLRSDVGSNGIRVEVRARYRNVEESDHAYAYVTYDPTTFVPNDIYSRAPGGLSNLKVIDQGHGIVMLTWNHPSMSYTKIKRFRIVVELLQTELLEKPSTAEFPITINYDVTQIRKEYSMMSPLSPSTEYRFSIVAVNHRNVSSVSKVYRKHSVRGSVGFDNDTVPQVTFDEITMVIELPRIVNATRNTTLKVIVQGMLDCTSNRLQKSSPRVNLEKSAMKWDAAEYRVGPHVPESLVIFAEQHQGVTSNCSLNPEETYAIELLVTELSTGRSESVLLTTSPNPRTSSLTWLIILPVIAICMVGFYIRYRNRTTIPKPPRRPSYLEILPTLPTTTSTDGYLEPRPALSSMCRPGAGMEQSANNDYTLPTEPDSCCVSVQYFAAYAEKATASGLLHSQFMLLREGLTKSCEYGRLPENLPKNRHENQIAYEDTRVLLKKIPGDPYSDYINASYIKGYKNERAYIATQGPTPNTVNDFWRMVWQEKVRVICMLTNVVEGEETKCEKYWPDVGTRVKYGDLLVLNTGDQVFADYTFRTFELIRRRDTQKVSHLHYRGWPSRGVPMYPQSLVTYLEKLRETSTGNGPVVVHCGTGDDRTGTIILCDICLRQAAAEKELNVSAALTRMRECRANMVGTLQQYVFAHIVITESLVPQPTHIPCTAILAERIATMRAQLPFDMQRLNDTSWQERALNLAAEPETSTVRKYCELSENKSSRFNAVSVDGVEMKRQYLASWLPTPLILSDFWGFIAEENIKLIIILQCSDPRNPTCHDVIPNDSIAVTRFNVQVEKETSPGEEEYLTSEKLLLTDTSEANARTHSMTVLTCKGWGCGGNAKPPSPAALISLWIASEKIQRAEGQTLVLCQDGVMGCGLYLALSFLLKRMSVEKECDVIAAVRAVRRSKSTFVQSMEQFEFLYDVAVDYIESFQSLMQISIDPRSRGDHNAEGNSASQEPPGDV